MSDAADCAEPVRPRKPYRSAVDRELRRRRIFARVREGWSHDRIAEAEGLTRARIRQIVGETLDRRAGDPLVDHRRLQIARLDPALLLAAQKVAAGELRAVDRLIRVLDRLDKYQRAAAAIAREEEDCAAQFDAKLWEVARRYDEDKARAADGEEPHASDGGGED